MRILAVDIEHVARVAWEGTLAHNGTADEAFAAALKTVTEAREGFDRCAVAVGSGPSFRKARATEYKAGRADPGNAYRGTLTRLVERLAADGCAILRAPKVDEMPHAQSGEAIALYAEADDVIGWLATEYSKHFAGANGSHLRILSGDGDLEQVINDAHEIDVMKPAGMVGGGGIWGSATVWEKRGVAPDRVADLKALAGDSTDNYKPFPGEPGEGGKRGPGIGDKGALKLLGLYGGALQVFDDANRAKWEADGVPPAMRALLDKHGVEAAAKGLFLSRLRADLPGLDFAAVLAEPAVAKIAPPARHFEDTKSEPPTIEGEPVAARPAPPPTSTALVRVDFDPLALQPRDLGQLETMAQIAFNSRCYGQFQNYEQVMMCMAEARERGIPLGTALRNAYIVKGKLAWSAAFLVGLILTSGKAEYFEIVETTDERATVAYQRKGRPGGTFTFTIEEAKRAGWMKSGDKGDGKWVTNPRTMLRWAALREAARAFFADVVSGMYTPDELRGGHVEEAEWETAA